MGLIADSNCVARLTNTFTCAEEGVEEYSFPKDIVSPVVMRLKNDKVVTNCADELAKRVAEGPQGDWLHIGDAQIQLLQPIKVVCQLQFEF